MWHNKAKCNKTRQVCKSENKQTIYAWNNIDNFTNKIFMESSQEKRVDIMQFHLYKVQKQAKLNCITWGFKRKQQSNKGKQRNCYNKSQESGYLWEKRAGKDGKAGVEMLLGWAANSLSLHLFAGYMAVSLTTSY